MPGHHIHAERRVVVVVELRPVERQQHLAPSTADEARPRRPELVHVQALVAQEPVELLDAVLRLDVGGRGVG